ncbi:MAG: ATP-binding protein [Atopobiaceae bacterium]|nr:ATP-binding protein [Atopobiaceae bacterium]
MNPFKPTAGKMPPILMGREQDLSDFFEGLTNGAGAPGRLMLVTGQRGFGKTVLLTEFMRMARAQEWATVLETANEGMCARIIESLLPPKSILREGSIAPSVSITGLGSASLGSVRLTQKEITPTLRSAINLRLSRVDEGKGIFFAIDEAQVGTREEMVAFATAIQLVIQEQDLTDLPDKRKKGVAFAFAGIPSIVDAYLDDRVLTFLRRCQRHDLKEIPLPDVRNGFVQVALENGKTITEDVATGAAEATRGFPYMVQLVGYYMWQSSDARRSRTIEREDVERARGDAVFGFQEAVCAPAYRSLTRAQRAFCLAMLEDKDEDSDVRVVAERAGRKEAWGRRYRKSLVDAHVVIATEPNMVRFDIPHFADYLRRTQQ